MAEISLPLDGGFYQSDSLAVSNQQCVNWYVNIPQTAGALSKAQLFGTPGSVQLATTGDVESVNRGAHVMSGIPYFVNAGFLYSLVRTVDSEGVESFSVDEKGVVTGLNRVSMVDNGTQLMIVVPGSTSTGYIYNRTTDTLVTITDPDFKANGEPQHVAYADGYFICTTDAKKWIISALNDGTNWNSLDRASAETDPDPTVAPIVHKNQVFIAGSETIEGFANQPQGADFPYVRTGLYIDKGVFAPFSVVNANDTFMFIGGGVNESPAIWAFSGSGVIKVSTTAIDSILQNFTDDEIATAFSYSYAQKGAYFVAFSLPTTTLVVDTITGKWHERKSQVVNSRGVTQTLRSRVNSLVFAYNRILVGDSVDGRIGHLDPNTYTEYGSEIVRTFVSAPFTENTKSLMVSSIEATVESGVGDETTPDPKLRLSTSNDSVTFKDELMRSIGRVGEYQRRAVWRRLGRFPRRVLLKFVLSDPVKPVLIDITAKLQVGSK